MTRRRKSIHGSVLRQTKDGWRIASVTSATVEDSHAWQVIDVGSPEKLATAVAEFVERKHLSHDILLALDARSCLPVTFSVNSLSELRDRRALSYRAEELLPLAAEDFVADFIHDDKQVLGIATNARDLYPEVAALEERGLRVQSIVPFAVAAIQEFSESNQDTSCDLIVWQENASLEVFRDGRRTSSWRQVPANAETLHRFLTAELLQFGGPLKVLLLDVDAAINSMLQAMPKVDSRAVATEPIAEYARRKADSILSGKSQPWCELRREKLIVGDPNRALRRDSQWCQWALALLLLATAFFFWNRGRQYKNLVASTVDRQQAVFQEVFPKSKVPGAIVGRLKSEKAKLAGARGKDATVEQPPSALNVLFEVLSGIPEEIRVQVQQLRVEDGRLYMDADVRSVGKAGELADGLQRQGFSIDPPTTEQYDAERVSVQINGSLESPRLGGQP